MNLKNNLFARALLAASLSTASPLARADGSSQKNAVQLLQDYTRRVSPENVDEVFDLFSEDALLEFPFFKSIGIGDHLTGRETIRKQIAPYVKNETENFRFHDIKIWASAEPDRAFGEYSVTAKIKFDRTSAQSNVCGPLRNEERKKLFILSNTESAKKSGVG